MFPTRAAWWGYSSSLSESELELESLEAEIAEEEAGLGDVTGEVGVDDLVDDGGCEDDLVDDVDEGGLMGCEDDFMDDLVGCESVGGFVDDMMGWDDTDDLVDTVSGLMGCEDEGELVNDVDGFVDCEDDNGAVASFEDMPKGMVAGADCNSLAAEAENLSDALENLFSKCEIGSFDESERSDRFFTGLDDALGRTGDDSTVAMSGGGWFAATGDDWTSGTIGDG